MRAIRDFYRIIYKYFKRERLQNSWGLNNWQPIRNSYRIHGPFKGLWMSFFGVLRALYEVYRGFLHNSLKGLRSRISTEFLEFLLGVSTNIIEGSINDSRIQNSWKAAESLIEGCEEGFFSFSEFCKLQKDYREFLQNSSELV